MITITQGFRSRAFPDDALPEICLKLNGGGHFEHQTRSAMRLQNEVIEKGIAVLPRPAGDITIKKD